MSQKQTGKGKGATHRSKHQQRKGETVVKELKLADKSYDEEYGVVMEELGGSQFVVEDCKGRRVRATISRGWSKGPNREQVLKGNTVVISPGIGKDTYHICHQYDAQEVSTLHSRGLIGKPKTDNEIDLESTLVFDRTQDAKDEQTGQDKDYNIEDL